MGPLAESCQILPDTKGPRPLPPTLLAFGSLALPGAIFLLFWAAQIAKNEIFSDPFFGAFFGSIFYSFWLPFGASKWLQNPSFRIIFRIIRSCSDLASIFSVFFEVFDWSFFCRGRFYLVIYEVFLHFHFCGRSRHLSFARRFFTRFGVPELIIFLSFFHAAQPPHFGSFF